MIGVAAVADTATDVEVVDLASATQYGNGRSDAFGEVMVQAFVTPSADRHPARRAGDRLAHPTMLMPSPVVALPGGTPVLRRRSTDNETILIIDDSPANLTVLGELLQGAGYRVKVANSGATGLHLAVQEPRPALILLDIMMPAMDGHEVLMLLRDNPQTRDTPVIFLTAKDTDADEERAFNDGIADYIVKPFALEELVARVQLALRRVGGAPTQAGRLQVHDLVLDTEAHRVWRGDVEANLTATEFSLLRLLNASSEMLFVGTLLAALPMPVAFGIFAQHYGLGEKALAPLVLSTIMGFIAVAVLLSQSARFIPL